MNDVELMLAIHNDQPVRAGRLDLVADPKSVAKAILRLRDRGLVIHVGGGMYRLTRDGLNFVEGLEAPVPTFSWIALWSPIIELGGGNFPAGGSIYAKEFTGTIRFGRVRGFSAVLFQMPFGFWPKDARPPESATHCILIRSDRILPSEYRSLATAIESKFPGEFTTGAEFGECWTGKICQSGWGRATIGYGWIHEETWELAWIEEYRKSYAEIQKSLKAFREENDAE